MKAVIERVKRASVTVDNETVGKINDGLFVLLGVEKGDSEKEAQKLAAKIAKMRIFSENDKLTNSVIDIGGGVLVVSNFTLAGNCRKGNRPDFVTAAGADEARKLYLLFIDEIIKNGVSDCQSGRFGADMTIDSVCDGPVTIILDSAAL